jgi:hypothetical protein
MWKLGSKYSSRQKVSWISVSAYSLHHMMMKPITHDFQKQQSYLELARSHSLSGTSHQRFKFKAVQTEAIRTAGWGILKEATQRRSQPTSKNNTIGRLPRR